MESVSGKGRGEKKKKRKKEKKEKKEKRREENERREKKKKTKPQTAQYFPCGAAKEEIASICYVQSRVSAQRQGREGSLFPRWGGGAAGELQPGGRCLPHPRGIVGWRGRAIRGCAQAHRAGAPGIPAAQRGVRPRRSSAVPLGNAARGSRSQRQGLRDTGSLSCILIQSCCSGWGAGYDPHPPPHVLPCAFSHRPEQRRGR